MFCQYLNEAVWFAHCCCWCLQAGSPWTRWSPGQDCHWRHTTWWRFLCARPPSAEDPCQWWGSPRESGFLQKENDKWVNYEQKWMIWTKGLTTVVSRKCVHVWGFGSNFPAKQIRASLVHRINLLARKTFLCIIKIKSQAIPQAVCFVGCYSNA